MTVKELKEAVDNCESKYFIAGQRGWGLPIVQAYNKAIAILGYSRKNRNPDTETGVIWVRPCSFDQYINMKAEYGE